MIHSFARHSRDFMKSCNVCNKEGKHRCSRCKQVSYCGIACQRKDYREHRKSCLKAGDLSLRHFRIKEARCTKCRFRCAPYSDVWERYWPCCDARLCEECSGENAVRRDHVLELRDKDERKDSESCPLCGEIVQDQLAIIEKRVRTKTDVQALYVLGYSRVYGSKNSIRRPLDGAALLEKAANLGHYEALYELAIATRDGYTGKADVVKAAKMFRVAAAQGGSAKALYQLALVYLSGAGVAKDPLEAARLFDLGARENFDPCKKALANLCIDGTHIAQDRVKAAHLLGLKHTADMIKKGIEPPAFLFSQGREAPQSPNLDHRIDEYTEAEMDDFFADDED